MTEKSMDLSVMSRISPGPKLRLHRHFRGVRIPEKYNYLFNKVLMTVIMIIKNTL